MRRRTTRITCWSQLVALILCASLAIPALAQPQAPLAGRPENYSGAEGEYSIRRAVVPTEVVVEDPILLTVSITGSGPKGLEPKRELLKLFPPEMERDFFVESVPEKDRYLPEEKTWEFVYRLRPKHVDVKQAPVLKFVHYNRDLKVYQPARTREVIELAVKPRPVATKVVPEGPLVIPPGFEKTYSTVDDLRPWRPWFWTTAPGMVLAFGLPVIGCGIWYWRWNRKYSASAQAARRHYHQAAQKALNEIRDLKPGVDGQRLATILASYVEERLDLPAKEPTGEEVAKALRQKRLSPTVVLMGKSVTQNIDAARFGPTNGKKAGMNPVDLAAFINKVEEALC